MILGMAATAITFLFTTFATIRSVEEREKKIQFLVVNGFDDNRKRIERIETLLMEGRK